MSRGQAVGELGAPKEEVRSSEGTMAVRSDRLMAGKLDVRVSRKQP